VRIIGCHWHKQNFTLWARAGVKTLNDLRGKVIGVSAPGSAPDIFVRAALAANNIPASQVRFAVAGAPPEVLKSIGAGVVDAGGLTNELDPRAAAMGLTRLTTSDAVSPLSMRRCFYSSVDVLQRHPDRAARFLAAEMQAYAYFLAHRDETLALTREITHATPASQEAVLAYDDVTSRDTVSLDFAVPMEKLVWLRDTLAQSGQLNASFDPASMIDTGPLTEARRMLAAAH
jgi:ABC-type nitrate/sulfonate/bicarbonate transport system substrate-binding protein